MFRNLCSDVSFAKRTQAELCEVPDGPDVVSDGAHAAELRGARPAGCPRKVAVLKAYTREQKISLSGRQVRLVYCVRWERSDGRYATKNGLHHRCDLFDTEYEALQYCVIYSPLCWVNHTPSP